MMLTQEECQVLIDQDHEWKTSEIIGRDTLVRDDTYEKRTFKVRYFCFLT